MTYLISWEQLGIIPLQHHDRSFSPRTRWRLSAARIGPRKGQDPLPVDDTRGDIGPGSLLWRAGAAREFLNTWFLGGVGAVSLAGGAGASGGRSLVRARTGAPADGWVPVRKGGDEADTRYTPIKPAMPSWVPADQVLPKGWTGIITAGSEEYEQTEALHPDAWGLVAVNKAGDPRAGSLVFDLKADGTPDRAARLQSAWSVVELAEPGDVTPPPPPSFYNPMTDAGPGTGGTRTRPSGGGGTSTGGTSTGGTGTRTRAAATASLAWQLGRGGNLDGGAGHGLVMDWTAGEVGFAAARKGGPWLTGGERGCARHQIGADAAGRPVRSIHLNPHVPWILDAAHDGPLAFEAPFFDESAKDFPHPAAAHIRYSAAAQAWRVQSSSIAYYPPPTGDPPPEDRDRDPKEGGDPKDPKDPPPFVPPPGESGEHLTTGPYGGGSIPAAGGQGKPEYPHITSCLALPNIILKGVAWAAGQADYTGSRIVDDEGRKRFADAPQVAHIQAVAAGDGTWDGFKTYQQNTRHSHAKAKGVALLLPADVTVAQVMTRAAVTQAPTALGLVPGLASLAMGTPDETGNVRSGSAMEGVDDTEIVDNIPIHTYGVAWGLVDADGDETASMRFTQRGSTARLALKGEGSTVTEIVADKVTCGVLDPYVIVMDPYGFPFTPVELSSTAPGLWTRNASSTPADGPPFDPYWFDGLDSRRLAYADELPSGSTGEVIPIGAIMSWHSSTPPTGFLLCDGSAVSRTDYADLFAVIGTTFGAGDGSTTFNLPNLTDRSPMGAGGSLVPSAGSTAGAATHTLTLNEIPAHQHTMQRGSNTLGPGNVPASSAAIVPGQVYTTDSAGGSQPHNNLHPVLGLFFVIAYQSFGLKGEKGDPGLDYTDNAALNALSGTTPAADRLPYFDSGTTAALTTLTAAGRALLDDADAAAQRTTLGLGTIATQDADNVAITGGSVTGIADLAVEDGGTGASTAADARANLGVPPTTRAINTTAPLTGGGDLSADRTIALAAQAANTVLAGPTSGAPAAPTARALVPDDIPALDAAKITSGTLDAARIPTLDPSKLSTTGANDGDVVAIVGGVPTWQAPSGKVVQEVHASISSVVSCSAVIPVGDTIPQQTDGTEVLTVSITPTSASSVLVIEFVGWLSASGGTTAALFRDSTSDAIAAVFTQGSLLVLQHYVAAGSTSPTTLKVRVGPFSAFGTLYINGNSEGGRIFGGVSATTLIVREVVP